MKKRFEIEFDTSVIDLEGNYFTVIVVVDDVDRFELWDPNRGIPVNLTALPFKDQAAIFNLVAQRFADRFVGFCQRAVFGDALDSALALREMNAVRGLR